MCWGPPLERGTSMATLRMIAPLTSSQRAWLIDRAPGRSTPKAWLPDSTRLSCHGRPLATVCRGEHLRSVRQTRAR